MSVPTQASGAGGSETPSPNPRRRRPVTPQEQARRVAWGHKWGPLVGSSIRQALALHDRQRVG